MEYTTTRQDRPEGSRICLGCMSYGVPEPRAHAWSLDGAARGRSSQRASNWASTSSTRERLLRRHQRGDPRPGDRDLRPSRRGRDRDQGLQPHAATHQRPGPVAQGDLTEIDASLRRLGTDYVDLYQIHRWDYDTPIEETLEALHDVVKAGKARYIGASSMYAWQFAKALYLADRHGWTRFVSMQNHYNLLYREEEREMIPLCVDQGIGVIPWSPLAAAGWPGPGTTGTHRPSRDRRVRQDALRPDRAGRPGRGRPRRRGGRRGAACPRAQVALAWMLAKPAVTSPIVGATKPHHLDDAVAALDVELTAEEIARLEEPYVPHTIAGHQ